MTAVNVMLTNGYFGFFGVFFTTCIVFISLVSSSVAEMVYSLEIYFKSLTFLQVTTLLVFIYAVKCLLNE